jgi:hypothetical protein
MSDRYLFEMIHMFETVNVYRTDGMWILSAHLFELVNRDIGFLQKVRNVSNSKYSTLIFRLHRYAKRWKLNDIKQTILDYCIENMRLKRPNSSK